MRRTLPPVLLIALAGSLLVVPLTAGSTTRVLATVVKTAFNARLKRTILVDSRGFTLYSWTQDAAGKPTCYNDPVDHCSKAWPPLTTVGAPHAGQGVKGSLLGTVKRKDGTLQVTYGKFPLYLNVGAKSVGLAADRKPGDANGAGFLSLWFALTPTGKPVMG